MKIMIALCTLILSPSRTQFVIPTRHPMRSETVWKDFPMHPLKLTWQREKKTNDLKMYLLLNSVIFHCHVSLLEGTVVFFELSQFPSHLRSLSPTLHLHLTRPWLHQGVGSWWSPLPRLLVLVRGLLQVNTSISYSAINQRHPHGFICWWIVWSIYGCDASFGI